MKTEYRVVTNGKFYKIEFREVFSDKWSRLSSFYDTFEQAENIKNHLIATDEANEGPWIPVEKEKNAV